MTYVDIVTYVHRMAYVDIHHGRATYVDRVTYVQRGIHVRGQSDIRTWTVTYVHRMTYVDSDILCGQ